MLVVNNESFQVLDPDFSTIFLILTVILVTNIPESAYKSWYCGIKITTTDSSTSLRNAVEITSVLTEKYGSKEAIPPVLIFYTDGDLEHQKIFLSVKIVLICLQKYLDLNQVLTVCTAPGLLYRNPAEKVNCLLNICHYGIGCMHLHSSDALFERSLS